jgi:signal transduction histidine kinase
MTLEADLGHESIDLRVWTTPFRFEGESFAVFAIRDTSDEQRRRVLERMFFHDVLNAAGGLRDVLRLWPSLSPEQMAELSERMAPLAAQVVEEIETQRDLAAAERGELTAARDQVAVNELVERLGTLYRHHSAADGKIVEVEGAADAGTIETDAVLLRRVLGNLLKNALEASSRGQRVALRFQAVPRPTFTVHNEGVMPGAVRLQVFQRSFSTKGGHGRGVGTYSARLLAERYLGGRLTFSSAEGEGTTFVLELPPAAG